MVACSVALLKAKLTNWFLPRLTERGNRGRIRAGRDPGGARASRTRCEHGEACRLIEEAAGRGATIAVFGEGGLAGHPIVAVLPSTPLRWAARAEHIDSAIAVPSDTTDRLCKAAKRAGIDVVIGIAELDARTKSTVYCTHLFSGREARILGKHRELKPIAQERTVCGEGDGSTLSVYERP